MSLFENIKLKLKKKSPVIEKLETSSSILKEQKDITVTGNSSVAFGVKNFPVPTGVCNNPVSEELIEYIKHDKLGQLLCNPICKCVFYDEDTHFCFFAGLCHEKQKITQLQVKEYITQMKAHLNQLYGDE